MNLEKQEFQKLWGRAGFTETFEGYPEGLSLRYRLLELIKQHACKDGVALEIGCGSGYYTLRWLRPNFKTVIAIDLLEAPSDICQGIEYHQAGNCDYSCAAVPDESVDFVYSLGCFCHLSNSANALYLQSVYRVLKTGGKALIVFANWPQHQFRRFQLEVGKANHREQCDDGHWFYNDSETVAKMAEQAGFGTFVDAVPGCRDLVALFKKGD